MARARRTNLRHEGRPKPAAVAPPERLELRLALSSAPVVTGPATATVPLAGSLRFAAPTPGAFTVTDADPTTTESVAVGVSAGTLSVDLSAVPSGGKTFYVETAAQFNAGIDKFGAAFATLHAGDRVLLKGGAWGGLVATITGSMTDAQAVSNPAMIIACDNNYVPTVGGVAVNGVSAIDLAGTGISFVGVKFSSSSGMLRQGDQTDYDDTGALAYLIRLDGLSRYMTVSQVAFDNCGWDSTDYANNDHYGSWIAVYGYHHTIRGCQMTGRDFDPNDINVADPSRRRSIREATIIIYKDSADSQYGFHQIDHNYFGERKIPRSKDPNLPTAVSGRGSADLYNGWETIRCGSGDFTTLDFNTTIEFNTFYHSIQSAYGNATDQTGEPEMVSIKSCRNTVRFNTILNNYGEVCIRQGDYNVVASNVFLAGGAYDASGNIVLTEQRNTRMGGVRVFGFGNTVANNYFYGLSADGIRSAVVLGSGGTDPGTLASLGNGSGTSYETATYTHVVGNTFIDCATITLDNPNGELYPVYGTQFLNNVITYSGDIGASGLVGNTDAGYGTLLLAAHGGRASGNYVYSPTAAQFGSAQALFGETWLNESFEAYATGATPNATTSPLLMATNYTTIASQNGGKMARYVKTVTGSGGPYGPLQYSLSSGNATARPQGFISFDIQQNANANVPNTNTFYFRLGDNDPTSSLASNQSAFIDLRFKQAATSNFSVFSNNNAIGTVATISPTAVNKVRVWYNNTAAAMNYVDPNNVDRTLSANSFVVFVNSTLMTPSASGSPISMPTNATTPAIGKIGFLTNSAAKADFSIDNVFAGDADHGGAVNTVSSTVGPGLTAIYDVLNVPAASSPLVGAAAALPTIKDTSSTAAAHDLAGVVAAYAAQDLRGLARPATGCDSGSYEVEATGTGFRPLRRAEAGLLSTASPTISGATLAAGANGGGALTITGRLGQLNAALATLTYTAPATGTAATLTVQANDGGAANNLSAILTTAITLSPTVTVNVAASQTVVDSAARSGAVQLVKQGTGTLVLSAAATFSGGVVVEQGEVVVRNTAALGSGSLTVRAGARATLDIGSAAVSVTSLNASGRIDLGTGRINVAGGWNAADIQAKLLAGFGDGSWNGTSGFTSSTAAATPYRAVGWLDNGDGSATIAFAAEGDTNLDGLVGLDDLQNILAAGKFGTAQPAVWADGDFNLDGFVDLSDLQDILAGGLYGQPAYTSQALASFKAASNTAAIFSVPTTSVATMSVATMSVATATTSTVVAAPAAPQTTVTTATAAPPSAGGRHRRRHDWTGLHHRKETPVRTSLAPRGHAPSSRW